MNHLGLKSGIIFCLVWIFGAGVPALGADVSLLLDGGTTRVGKRVKSMLELRRENVILQNLDFSCGAAALATVLRYGFGEDTSERELISLIFVFGQTPEKGVKKYFKRQGFTLLDLKRAARAKGFPSVGYKGMTFEELIETLEEERLPILVPVRPMDYNHFVVVKGVIGNRVYFADPAFGNKTMTVSQFTDVWIDGIGFIVKARPDMVKNSGRHVVQSDEELELITAGGSTAIKEIEESPPSDTLLDVTSTRDSVDYWRIQKFMIPVAPHLSPNLTPTIQTTDGQNLISTFQVQGFQGALQLGRPSGNFLDFSPPPGQALSSGN
ncbi:MAG TPA: C39 family peptidase [Nitrospirales bacterium]|nr:C39 family peptidase [Nitrospirales bacterium]